MNEGLYVYGVIASSDAQEFGAIGIGDQASDVLSIGFKDIAAVVSSNPLTVYDSLTKEKTVKDLVTHQFVIETVMRRFTILPVKFGTMLETEADVLAFLKNGYALLSGELRKMAGKIELNVVANWDLQKILASLYRNSARVQKKQKELSMKGATVGIEDKIELGRVIEQALQAEKIRYHQLILQTLKAGAVDVCLHEVASEEMVFNAALLIDKQREELLNETVTTLDHTLENAFNFRVVGPLPVYSFSTILFERIDPQKFDEAKKVFGLHGEVTDTIVRETYHNLAKQCHPDKTSAKGSLTFPVLNAAYRTLKKAIEHGLMHVEVYHWEQSA